MKKIAFVLLFSVSVISFGMWLIFTYQLDIHKVILKEGIFDITGKENMIKMSKLRNSTYNLFIRFFKQEKMDYGDLFEGNIPYQFILELRDNKDELIKKTIVDEKSNIPGGFSVEDFEWQLMHFNTEKVHLYKLDIKVNSDFKAFDKMKKEIYIEQPYDRASEPFWELFQILFLVLFLVSVVPATILGLIIFHKKGKEER